MSGMLTPAATNVKPMTVSGMPIVNPCWNKEDYLEDCRTGSKFEEQYRWWWSSRPSRMSKWRSTTCWGKRRPRTRTSTSPDDNWAWCSRRRLVVVGLWPTWVVHVILLVAAISIAAQSIPSFSLQCLQRQRCPLPPMTTSLSNLFRPDED